MRHYVGANFIPYDENEWLLPNPHVADIEMVMDNSSAITNNEETEEITNDLWAPDMDMGLFSTGGYGYNNSYGEYGWDMDGGELDEVVIYGNYYGNDHYTEEEYWDMVYNGTWEGGYVDGWEYTFPDIYIFPGDGDYYTFPDYIRSESMDNLEYLMESALDKIIDTIKYTGALSDYWDYMENAMDRMHRDIQATLLQMGYDSSALFYIDNEVIKSGNSYRIKFNVYDAKKGNWILSREITVFGNIY
ncbi:hypothetical protein [Bacteroides bouchesdurhonensis]|uniref:hypothetical protein n=1 Tax=Bacteroides bouchesdurhonensis TaxID=1841855 RepID=UPI00097F906B|nr:hypothetical protein [Bacteroides bouchesdurhonensis]